MMQKKEMIMQFFESDLDPRLCMIEDMIERGEVYQGYRQSYTRPTRPTRPATQLRQLIQLSLLLLLKAQSFE